MTIGNFYQFLSNLLLNCQLTSDRTNLPQIIYCLFCSKIHPDSFEYISLIPCDVRANI